MNHILLLNLIKLARIGAASLGSNQPAGDMAKVWDTIAAAEQAAAPKPVEPVVDASLSLPQG